MTIFAKRLIDLREEKHLKQIELANELNISQSSMSIYEKGEKLPPTEMVLKIAEFFAVSVDYLLGVSSERNPYSPARFTVKEAEMITRYRNLNKENQIRIDERISAMLDNQRG